MGRQTTYEAIVVGTSAGGLQALTGILQRLPENFALPVLVVQHRAKDQRGLLEQILQEKCSIQVKQADEKEKIKKGTVYIAPPDYHLLVEGDKTLALNSDPQVNFSRPSIDVLFESAAEVYREKLIGIVLTGANSDGTIGISSIKEKGGVTIAQNPSEAEHPMMPMKATQTNHIEQILNLDEIANFLLKIHDEQK